MKQHETSASHAGCKATRIYDRWFEVWIPVPLTSSSIKFFGRHTFRFGERNNPPVILTVTLESFTVLSDLGLYTESIFKGNITKTLSKELQFVRKFLNNPSKLKQYL